MVQFKNVKYKEEFRYWFLNMENSNEEELLCHLRNLEFVSGLLKSIDLTVPFAVAQFVLKDEYEEFEKIEQFLMNDSSKISQSLTLKARYQMLDSWNHYSTFIKQERENLFYKFINEQLETGMSDDQIFLKIQFEVIKDIL